MSAVSRCYAFAPFFAALICSACQPSEPANPPQVSEHAISKAAAYQSLAIGADCTAGGGPQCESGLCLHISADPQHGYVCSRLCQIESDCLTGWKCGQFYPGPDGMACIPQPAPGN